MLNSDIQTPRPLDPEAENRFVGGFGEQIRNSDLLCARCANLWEDETAECEIYSQKPLAVLRGEDACPDFLPRGDPAQGQEDEPLQRSE